MNLDALRTAIEPLTSFGNEELTFKVEIVGGENLRVTLRPLLPREEVLCQERAGEILEEARKAGETPEDPLTRTTALTYFDTFRVEVISYALVQIGANDLRVGLVDTGEVLENGTAVKVPKQKALKGLIMGSWSRGMITLCFSKYGDMVARIADRADKIVSESLSDLDAEIKRAEIRVTELKTERDKRAKGDPSIANDQIRNLVEFGAALESEIETAVEKAKIESDLMQGLVEDSDTAEAPEAEPEAPEAEPEAPEAEPEAPEAEPEAPEAEPEAPEAEPEPDAVDFFESKEPQEAAQPPPAPEAAKPSKKKKKKPRKPVTPPEVPPPSVAPELSMEERIIQAQKTAQSENLSGLDKAVPDGHVTTASGEVVAAYRLPAQTLSERGREERAKPAVTQDPRRGTLNPNFKPKG